MIWSHYYPLGLDGVCRLAYKDLETLGNLIGVGYIAINLFLFIALFLGLMAFNILIMIKCKTEKAPILILAKVNSPRSETMEDSATAAPTASRLAA